MAILRGLLDDTLVVLATEFGRTPRINQNVGRDHYSKAFYAALIGGGFSFFRERSQSSSRNWSRICLNWFQTG